jgi:hypothetical protein
VANIPILTTPKEQGPGEADGGEWNRNRISG